MGRGEVAIATNETSELSGMRDLRCAVHVLQADCRAWAHNAERLPSTAQTDTETQQHLDFLGRAADGDADAAEKER